METIITLKDLLKRWKEEAHIEKDVTLVSKKGNSRKGGELYEKYFQMIKSGKTDKGERILLSPFVVEKLEKIEFVETFDKI